MAAFVRQRIVGGWVTASVVPEAEWEAIDDLRLAVLNGVDGSTHAPTLPIVIGGAGLQVTGGFEASDVNALAIANGGAVNFANGSELNFADAVVVTVDDGAWFFTDTSALHLTNSAITISTGSDITVETGGLVSFESGSALTVLSGTIVTVGATVDIAATGSIVLAVGATFEAGSVQIDTTGISMPGGSWATATGNLTMTNKVILSGSTAGIALRVGTVTDTPSTIDVSKDVWQVPKALAAVRRYTLRHSTSPIPTEGQTITVNRSFAITSDAEFQREDTTLLATLEIGGQDVKSSITFVYRVTDGGWVVLNSTGTATVESLGGTYH